MKTGGLPHKSYMTFDLFRIGDRVSPTYGLLRGHRGVINEMVTTPYGQQFLSIEFADEVRKYRNQPAKRRWCYEPENVRLEAFGNGASIREESRE